MKLSQAIAKRRDIVVEFEGANLNVVYRPANFTIRELDEITAASKRPDAKPTAQLLATVKRVIVQWDLTDEYDKIIPLNHPAEDVDNDPLRDVPTIVYTEIMKQVNEDQNPGGDKPSSAR